VLTLPQHLPLADSDGLQADVMRFLAIIAFCLIAVLALVRQTEPAEQTPPAAAGSPAPVAPAPLEVSVEDPAGHPVAPSPAAPVRAPARATPAAPEAVAAPPATPEAAPAPQPVTRTAPPAREPARAAPPATEERGLTLRFASERDFLTLLRRGDIRVYAYRPGLVLGLSSDFRFEPVSGPGALYEMQRTTIPAAVTGLLGSSEHAGSAGELTWGVQLPAKIRHDIDSRLQQGASGELLIDARGGLRHVAAP